MLEKWGGEDGGIFGRSGEGDTEEDDDGVDGVKSDGVEVVDDGVDGIDNDGVEGVDIEVIGGEKSNDGEVVGNGDDRVSAERATSGESGVCVNVMILLLVLRGRFLAGVSGEDDEEGEWTSGGGEWGLIRDTQLGGISAAKCPRLHEHKVVSCSNDPGSYRARESGPCHPRNVTWYIPPISPSVTAW